MVGGPEAPPSPPPPPPQDVRQKRMNKESNPQQRRNIEIETTLNIAAAFELYFDGRLGEDHEGHQYGKHLKIRQARMVDGSGC
jgi:hypothetical protein